MSASKHLIAIVVVYEPTYEESNTTTKVHMQSYTNPDEISVMDGSGYNKRYVLAMFNHTRSADKIV